jgi:PII-like signaling protein
MTVVAVDVPEKLDRAIPFLDEKLGSGPVVISDVDVIIYRATKEEEPK